MAKGRQRLIEEQDFYNELDKDTRGSCCSCPTFLLFFIILFIILLVGGYFLSKKISSAPISFNLKPIHLSLPSSKSTSTGNSLTLTDQDLQSIIWGGPQLLLPLTDKKASVDNSGIIIQGNIPTTNNPAVALVLKPVAQDGKIVIESVTLRQGPAAFNSEFSDLIKSKVQDLLSAAVTKKFPHPIKSIQTSPNKLTIQG